MLSRFSRVHWYDFLVLFLFAGTQGLSQDVAFFTSLKGSVSLKRTGEQTRSALLLDKLSIGDEIRTGENGSFTIMFYTGKELRIGKRQTFTVTEDKESPGFLKRIAFILSGLIWDTTQARIKTGGTRGSFPNRRAIEALEPGLRLGSISGSKLLYQKDISFKWDDTLSSSETEYHLRIMKSPGAFDKTIAVRGATIFVATPSSLGLEQSGTYTWSVKDEKTNVRSGDRRFSFLSPNEEADLKAELEQIRKQPKGVDSDSRIALLSSALYMHYGLYTEIEGLLEPLTKKNPEFLPAYEILTAVYDRLEIHEKALNTKEKFKSVIDKLDHSQ